MSERGRLGVAAADDSDLDVLGAGGTYHGINLAYLKLATVRADEARRLAVEVRKHCAEREKLSEKNAFWRLATEGNLCTIPGAKEGALAKHKEAAAIEMSPWQARLWKSKQRGLRIYAVGTARSKTNWRIFIYLVSAMGGCALIEEASVCTSRNWGFCGGFGALLLSSSTAEHSAVNRRVVGSNPT